MALPEYFKEELKQRCEIGEIISSYVNLKRRGKKFGGALPFHNERRLPLWCIRKTALSTVSAAIPAAM